MNKRKFFTVFAGIVLPIVVIAALISTSSQLFKGSLLDDLIGSTDFTVAITNPGFDQVANTDEPVISQEPLYIDTTSTDPYLFNFITSEDDDVSYNLSLFSFSQETDFSADINFTELDAESAMTGSLTNVNIIKDSSGNIIEKTTGFKNVSNANQVQSFTWNKECRYDVDIKNSVEIDSDSDLVEFNPCDTGSYHYLSLNVKHNSGTTKTRSIVFPIQFQDSQNINWTLPNSAQPRFLEGAGAAVNKDYLIATEETPTFNFSSSAEYTYNIALISSDEADLISELTQLNESDLVQRELDSVTESTTGSSNFVWDKTCTNSAGDEVECTDPAALSHNAIKISITIDDATKHYYFPISLTEYAETNPSLELYYPVKAIDSSLNYETLVSETDIKVSNHTSGPIQIPKLLEGETVPFVIHEQSNNQYNYSLQIIQTDETPVQIANKLKDEADFDSSETINTTTDSRSGYDIINWDGQCLEEDGGNEYCNNNYAIITLNNPNSDPVKTSYYIYELQFTANSEPSIYWLENQPFIDLNFADPEDDDTYQYSETLSVNLENFEPLNFYFNTNRESVNFRGKIYYNGTGGEITVAELNSGTTGNASQANSFTWDKTCRLADGSANTAERCIELMTEEGLKFKAFFEKDYNSDEDFNDQNERLTYESNVQFLRFLEPEWIRPVRATNINFDDFNTNISDFGTDPVSYIYPRNIYVDLSDDVNLTFEIQAPDTAYTVVPKFVYADDLTAAYNRSDRNLLKGNLTLPVGDAGDTKIVGWNKVCDDDSDGELLDCISPEINNSEKAIEIMMFSTEEGVDTNSIVYIFPLSFDTPNRPSITINSPEATEEPDQDFVPVLVETGEAAVCKASLDNAHFNFDTEGTELTPNTDKTEHTTEEIIGLANNTNYTLHVKCAVESLPTIQNYAKIDFSIGRDGLNIDWISPDFQDSDFEDTADDAGKPFVAVYNTPLPVNSESTGNLSIKFKPINKELDYETFITTSGTEIDFDEILNDPEGTEASSFFDSFTNLAEVDGNTASNYSRNNIDPDEETTIRWDKQCVNTDGTDKTCLPDEYNVLAIQMTDQDTGDTNTYLFPLSITDESAISSCEITGDELVFNPNTEGLLFSFDTSSENITQFDYTLKIMNSSDSEVAEIVDENNVTSATGTFAWEGEIGSNRTVSDGNYSVVFTVQDQNSDTTCSDSWNFLVDNREPFTNAEFEILLDDDEFTAPEETLEITLNQNKDSYRTVLNVYKKGKNKPEATIYSCVAGEDTDAEDEACPDDLSFEWDGSHFFDYLPEGTYFLKGSILDASGITTASISEDFTFNHGNIRNTASDNRCTDYFTDIASNDPLCSAVTFVREAEIFLGSNGAIDINRPLSRAEFITVTNRIKQLENSRVFSRISPYSPQRDGDMGHSDLRQFVGNPSARWFMDEIWKAKQAGLVRGYEDGTMKPLNLIAGPEAFKLVQLSTEVNSSTETKNPWYSDYTEFNYRNGIDTGGITEFTTAVTRGQLIYYIYQLNRAGLYTP